MWASGSDDVDGLVGGKALFISPYNVILCFS